jgi:SH3 domain protein
MVPPVMVTLPLTIFVNVAVPVTVKLAKDSVVPPNTFSQTVPLKIAQSPTDHKLIPSNVVVPATETAASAGSPDHTLNMTKRYLARAGFLALMMATGAAQALDFASVALPSAILYDAPSLKAKKLFVVSRYMPLEQVVKLNDWVKVRDQTGTLAWIAKSALDDKRYVVVTTALADVRQTPNGASPLMFQARRQVALEWLEDTGFGWIKVRHTDGATGYIKTLEVWGD